nr:MAG TPA: hypothetical protein [Bacteriophage sp.]
MTIPICIKYLTIWKSLVITQSQNHSIMRL